MPGGDGIGPRGMGPMTGRGAGYCAGYPYPGFANSWPRRFWRRGWYGRPGFYGPAAFPAAVDEKAMLKQQAQFLKDQLQWVEERLKEISESKKDE
ncbi:MAG: DUF5320 domain-containing protein [Firmicutes bacterium]|nr:DUF5320 domain-containing protein [Bacillota bacterium]